MPESSYQLANAVRIWQDPTTHREFEANCCFLWEMVTRIEHENNSCVAWLDPQPKVYVRLADDTELYLIGSLKRWNERWNRYLLRAETRTLLFEN